jgi:PAS domain S-box-containing protein
MSERKLIEKKLLKSEEKFRDLYENAPNAYFSVGTDSIIRNCNRRAEELVGYTNKELIGRSIFELYADTPEGKAKAEETFKKFIAGESVNDVEVQMRKSDNSDVWVSLSVNIIFDRNGEIVESRSMIMDITDRKRVEEERDRLIRELTGALSEVKKLSGLLPICSSCKKIRDDEGYWKQIEQFIGERSEAEFTHGICPDCAEKLYSKLPKDGG